MSKAVFLNTLRHLPPTNDVDRYQAILNIFKGVEEYILDTNGTIVSSNLEAVTITGYEEWEIIGRHFSIFYTIEDQIKRKYELDLERAHKNRYCYVSGIKLKKRNSPFYAKLKLTVITGEDNVVTGFRLTIQDTTHKAMYSHNISIVKDEYLALFNNPFIGIFKFRLDDFKLLMVNEKAESFFGKQWNGRHLDTYFIESSQFQSFIDTIKSKKKVENFEFEISNHSGKTVWVNSCCKLFSSLGFVEGIMVDITEKKNEIEKVIALGNELESFIYHASHDLRSPITSIYGLVNLLQKDPEPGSISKYSRLIEDRLLHLDNILRDIVEIAFNTSVQLQPENIDFNKELQSLIHLQGKTHSVVSASFSVDHNDGIEFCSDSTRIRSILRNIISNAFKYHNPNATRPFVNIHVTVKEDKATLIVEDNGIGIHTQHLDKVFSLFYRATESYKGNGLGLYIVKSMVAKLGGEVWIQSSLGEGTKFRIDIPNISH